jgi:hypothetical protein
LVRVFKLFKLFRQRQRLRKLALKVDGGKDEQGDNDEPLSEQLAGITTQKVIVIVIILIAMVPLLDVNPVDNGPTLALGVLESASLYPAAAGRETPLEEATALFLKQYPMTVYLRVLNETLVDKAAARKPLRYSEVIKYYTKTNSTYLILDVQADSQQSAWLQLALTAIIVFILGVASIFFSKDADIFFERLAEGILPLLGGKKKELEDPATVGLEAYYSSPHKKKSIIDLPEDVPVFGMFEGHSVDITDLRRHDELEEDEESYELYGSASDASGDWQTSTTATTD